MRPPPHPRLHRHHVPHHVAPASLLTRAVCRWACVRRADGLRSALVRLWSIVSRPVLLRVDAAFLQTPSSQMQRRDWLPKRFFSTHGPGNSAHVPPAHVAEDPNQQGRSLDPRCARGSGLSISRSGPGRAESESAWRRVRSPRPRHRNTESKGISAPFRRSHRLGTRTRLPRTRPAHAHTGAHSGEGRRLRRRVTLMFAGCTGVRGRSGAMECLVTRGKDLMLAAGALHSAEGARRYRWTRRQ
jgi:hypothetical protein